MTRWFLISRPPCGELAREPSAEAALNGRAVEEATILAAAKAAAGEVDPPEDFHASAAYRRNLVAVLTERALKRAAA